MYEFLKSLVLPLLRCPAEAPEAPAGSYESVLVFRASPKYWKYRLVHVYVSMIGAFIGEAITLIFLLVAMPFAAIVLVLLMLVFVVFKILFLYVVTRLDYEMRYYIITDRSLRIREGVVIIREITLTFENIQNMRINQGPLQRIFGLYDLVVETAGGGGVAAPQQEQQNASFMHRGVFRGIGRPEELRDLILSYLKQVRSSGLGDQDDDEAVSRPLALPSDVLAALRAIREESAAMRRAVEA